MSLDSNTGEAEGLSGEVGVGDTLVEVANLKKYYDTGGIFSDDPVQAVDDVTFDIQKGETLGLVGESGCGKTTLGRTLLRLETATEGSVTADGTDITTLSGSRLREWQRDAQMVFQDPDSSLNDRMTVGEIIREPLDAHGWSDPEDRRDRVERLLDRVGLNEEHYYRYPHQFSGGQKQRIGIARALALEPEFIVLDEPVSALDVSVQARIINLLEDLQNELGLTYLFIAHDLSVVRHIADRVAVMYLGNIVELGETEAVYTNPQHPYTISLLSAIPGSGRSATWEGERVTLHGTPPNPRDPPAGCPFATRCPAKIRPDEYDLSEEAWTAIEQFRTLLRERSRAETGALDAIKRHLGLGAGVVTVEEIEDELFGELTLPQEVQVTIDEAVDLAEDGEDRAAEERLGNVFGSVCDTEYPREYDAAGRKSRCLRHEAEYRSPQEVIRDRTPTD